MKVATHWGSRSNLACLSEREFRRNRHSRSTGRCLHRMCQRAVANTTTKGTLSLPWHGMRQTAWSSPRTSKATPLLASIIVGPVSIRPCLRRWYRLVLSTLLSPPQDSSANSSREVAPQREGVGQQYRTRSIPSRVNGALALTPGRTKLRKAAWDSVI